MTQTSTTNDSEFVTAKSAESAQSPLSFDMFATGIATGIVVTTIVETGKGAVGLLAKNPLVVLGAGIMTGYFTHKYRKEIILSSQKVAAQSKDFVTRQKKAFTHLLNENEEN